MKNACPILILSLLAAGCQKEKPAVKELAPAEPATVSVSHWTDKTELFMEYQPLVAGVKRRFSVHFTSLANFKPLASGQATITLSQGGAAPRAFTADAPSRPGIFGVDVTLARSGRYRMAVQLRSKGLDDSHDLGEAEVHASPGEIRSVTEKAKEETIAFLKEQQWALDFGTQLIAGREMRESLRVSGEVRPRSGGEVQVTAPVAGRIGTSSRMPVAGTQVSRGQALASIAPLTPAPADRPALEYAISEAATAADLARRNQERAESLLKAGAVPARRLEEARAALATADARLKAANARLSQYETSRQAEGDATGSSPFAVRAPISGVIAEVKSTPGANVAQGDSLFRIVAVDSVYAVANVPEAEVPRLSRLAGAEIEIPGAANTLPAGSLVARSSFVDPRSRTLGVIYEVANEGRRLAIGQSVSVRLFLSTRVRALAVPASAIIDDGGRPVVFVQLEGEAFARRPVTLGIREADFVQVLEGLRPGDRVVTRGAYLIRLAALSTQIPAHGHVH
ncbi:MAG: efflux RND transporter periplasmic adaptor subunit [Acidobacteria bacterium]|nr:efflux RND transporter periplasmic adaptor subunit [Acidobacteriota bacterium]